MNTIDEIVVKKKIEKLDETQKTFIRYYVKYNRDENIPVLSDVYAQLPSEFSSLKTLNVAKELAHMGLFKVLNKQPGMPDVDKDNPWIIITRLGRLVGGLL